MLVSNDFVPRFYSVDISLITTILINGLSADSTSFFFFENCIWIVHFSHSYFFHSSMNGLIIMYIVIFEFMFDTFTFACPPDLFIRSSSVLSSRYLKHACRRWFRFSFLFSRHKFDHDYFNKWPVCWFNILFFCSRIVFELFIFHILNFFTHQWMG